MSFDILSTVICPFKNSLSVWRGAKRGNGLSSPLLSFACFFISFHLFANRTEKRNKARTRKRPKFIPKFIVRIVRDDQSLPDSIVKTESLSLSLSALDPVLFSRFRRPSRFIGECNFRWSRNPAERRPSDTQFIR